MENIDKAKRVRALKVVLTIGVALAIGIFLLLRNCAFHLVLSPRFFAESSWRTDCSRLAPFEPDRPYHLTLLKQFSLHWSVKTLFAESETIYAGFGVDEEFPVKMVVRSNEELQQELPSWGGIFRRDPAHDEWQHLQAGLPHETRGFTESVNGVIIREGIEVLPSLLEINAITLFKGHLYAGTNHGVYQWKTSQWQRVWPLEWPHESPIPNIEKLLNTGDALFATSGGQMIELMDVGQWKVRDQFAVNDHNEDDISGEAIAGLKGANIRSMVAGKDGVYAATDQCLYVLRDGSMVWNAVDGRFGGQFGDFVSLSVNDSKILLGTNRGAIYQLKADSGN